MSARPPPLESLYGSRLSPPPDARRYELPEVTPADNKQLNSWELENWNCILEALNNRTTIPNYSVVAQQAAGPPAKGTDSFRGGDTITIPANKSTIVCDRQGNIVLVVLRDYVGQGVLSDLNTHTSELMEFDLKHKDPADLDLKH